MSLAAGLPARGRAAAVATTTATTTAATAAATAAATTATTIAAATTAAITTTTASDGNEDPWRWLIRTRDKAGMERRAVRCAGREARDGALAAIRLHACVASRRWIRDCVV
jgi:hypothetical protein